MMPERLDKMQTERLELIPLAPAHFRAMMAGAEVFAERPGLGLAEGIRELAGSGEMSPEFRALLAARVEPDPWTFGFAVGHRGQNLVIGLAGFKGPPADRLVEIAYGIVPGFQGQGYATEAAGALCDFARMEGGVALVRAHTLPERNASTRVLEKCGFARVGEVVDPEDGLVWRWEREVG